MDTDKMKAKETQDIGEVLQKNFWEDLPDISDRVKEVLQGELDEMQTEKALEPVVPKIKGLDILKESVFKVDLEKTVSEMLMVIKNMENHLERVLKINSHLQKELNDAKEIVVELKGEKSGFEKKIDQIEKKLPSKRDLEMENEQLIEEHNNFQKNNRDQRDKIQKMQDGLIDYQRRLSKLEVEKGDLIEEIDFIETRLKTATVKIKSNKTELNELTGEIIAKNEKIRILEAELKDALDDKFKLLNEIKRSKKVMAELHSAISDKKIAAKKNFYKEAGQKR